MTGADHDGPLNRSILYQFFALSSPSAAMRLQKLEPVAHRRGDRIRVGSIAAMLSAFIAVAAFPSTFAPNPSELASSKEDVGDLGHVEGRNISKIRAGERERCEMSPEDFAKVYPGLIGWIRNTLTASAPAAHTVASRGFSRLPLYFTEETLAATKVVLVDPLPMPPLSSMGLARFADFVRGNFDGITFIDTIFVKPTESNNENVHFHELVHVIQWRLLGPDRFCCRMRTAWNASAIGRAHWKLWRMMLKQRSQTHGYF